MMKLYSYGAVLADVIDHFTGTVEELLHRRQVGTCQAEDCQKAADLSDSKTSLSYCRAHYFLNHLETFSEQVARLKVWYSSYFDVEGA